VGRVGPLRWRMGGEEDDEDEEDVDWEVGDSSNHFLPNLSQ
jgi:hypothetical protein